MAENSASPSTSPVPEWDLADRLRKSLRHTGHHDWAKNR